MPPNRMLQYGQGMAPQMGADMHSALRLNLAPAPQQDSSAGGGLLRWMFMAGLFGSAAWGLRHAVTVDPFPRIMRPRGYDAEYQVYCATGWVHAIAIDVHQLRMRAQAIVEQYVLPLLMPTLLRITRPMDGVSGVDDKAAGSGAGQRLEDGQRDDAAAVAAPNTTVLETQGLRTEVESLRREVRQFARLELLWMCERASTKIAALSKETRAPRQRRCRSARWWAR